MTLHAMHCRAERPHLTTCHGGWKCFFKGRVEFGETPREAYENWYMSYSRITGTPHPRSLR